jgi:hypothetical protein
MDHFSFRFLAGMFWFALLITRLNLQFLQQFDRVGILPGNIF